ncbi:MAG: hypothetical protein ASARMPREDX12_001962 [Alectoria sarmentosa]|nr:MAG: hypothetical protein ASARMPREDX12_001962 [Alectoria sarmentosa]
MLRSGPSSAVVRILAANVISYMRQIYNGERQDQFPTPSIPGASAIGRIATVGPDATLLKPGMLVFEDCTIRGRDNATAVFLSGIHGGYSKLSEALMRGEWKDSIYAEYAKVPLETREILDERNLFGKMGYEIADLAYIAALVIAMGRNMEALERIKKRSERIEVVPIPGDLLKDSKASRSFGAVDAFFDISPSEAGKSTPIKSGILALKHSGRFMHMSLTLKGKWMFEREDIKSMIKMVNSGVLKLGESAGLRVVVAHEESHFTL